MNYLTKEEAIEGLKIQNAECVYLSENILIVKLNSHESARFFGQGTRWCISLESSHCFKLYTERYKTTLYAMFDFEKNIKQASYVIGAAICRDGEVHTFLNGTAHSPEQREIILNKLKLIPNCQGLEREI